jgi:hypothetical protein
MPEFVPSGYFSIHEALNRLGRELFPSAWTGEEHTARRGLIRAALARSLIECSKRDKHPYRVVKV